MRITTALLVGWGVVIGWGGTAAWSEDTAVVACGSSFIAMMVYDLLGEEVQTMVLVSPRSPLTEVSAWPPDILHTLARTPLLVYHPFQSRLLRQLQEHDFKRLRMVPLRGRYTLTIPGDYLKAVRELHPALLQAFPEYSSFMEERLAGLEEQAQSAANQALASIRDQGVYGRSCLASRPHAEFLTWLGLRVVDTFDSLETLTPSALEKLKQQAQNYPGIVVVGVEQGQGPEAARKVAEEVNAPVVILSAAPYSNCAENGMAGWQRLLQNNVQHILETIRVDANPNL